MPISTSNSNARAPQAPYRRIWALTLLLVTLLLSGTELYLRRVGHQRSVVDSTGLWALVRHQVGQNPKSLVILGSSRAQLAIRPSLLAKELPDWHCFLLAKAGLHPLAALRDLAESDFDGVAVVECAPDFLTSSKNREDQKSLVERYHRDYDNLGYFQREFNQRLATWLQPRFALLTVLTNPYALLGGRVWKPSHIVTRADRSSESYTYASFSSDQLHSFVVKVISRKGPPPTKEWVEEQKNAWDQQIPQVARYVADIRQRGGVVIFLRMPVHPRVFRADALRYPRDRFWDTLGPATEALTIHFQDEVLLQNFECPDGQHLDHRDAEKFTTNLAAILRRSVPRLGRRSSLEGVLCSGH